MKIADYIRQVFWRSEATLRSSFVPFDIAMTRDPFGLLVFRNAVELLTDICNDVTWKIVSGDPLLFAAFRVFFEMDGSQMLWRVYRNGYAVVGVNNATGTLSLLDEGRDYQQTFDAKVTKVKALNANVTPFVVASDTYRDSAMSDWQLCLPFVKWLDNTLNASNTMTERLGAFVIASPDTAAGSPTVTVLNEEQKKKLEEDIEREYGALRKQKQIMVLPRGMKFETVSLCQIDNGVADKVRMAVCAIADRVKVPANQMALIDTASSKSFANGSEEREGDKLKYKSFHRLLNHTFVRLAYQMGMTLDYDIFNEPKDIMKVM